MQGDYVPCAFRLAIKTWDVPHTGTTSNVSITVGDKEGKQVVIPNILDWNRNKPNPGYVFFQPGNVDLLDGQEDCYALASHPCLISVTITGTGDSPSWLLDYVIVDAPPVGNQRFDIRRWLSSYGQYSAFKNLCPRPSKGKTSSTEDSLAI